MSVAALNAQSDLLTALPAGFGHPYDGIREVAALVTRRVLLNLPPAYMELSTETLAAAAAPKQPRSA
jgi:hypothetical protein